MGVIFRAIISEFYAEREQIIILLFFESSFSKVKSDGSQLPKYNPTMDACPAYIPTCLGLAIEYSMCFTN